MLAFVERGTVACASCRLRRSIPNSNYYTNNYLPHYGDCAIVPIYLPLHQNATGKLYYYEATHLNSFTAYFPYCGYSYNATHNIC